MFNPLELSVVETGMVKLSTNSSNMGEVGLAAGQPLFMDAEHRFPASLPALLESLLFIAPEPTTVRELSGALGCAPAEVADALKALGQSLCEDSRGLRLQKLGSRYALVTMPEATPAIERYSALASHTRLSRQAMETLAIVAYQQPVTRGQIEAVRGVDCAHILRSLLDREFIETRGHRPTVGHPILYGVTEIFLQYFGLTSLLELPDLDSEDWSKLGDAMHNESILDTG